jgi:hypothetical protein
MSGIRFLSFFHSPVAFQKKQPEHQGAASLGSEAKGSRKHPQKHLYVYIYICGVSFSVLVVFW